MLRRQQAEERRMVYENVRMTDRKAFANASWQEKTVRERQNPPLFCRTSQYAIPQPLWTLRRDCRSHASCRC